MVGKATPSTSRSVFTVWKFTLFLSSSGISSKSFMLSYGIIILY